MASSVTRRLLVGRGWRLSRRKARSETLPTHPNDLPRATDALSRGLAAVPVLDKGAVLQPQHERGDPLNHPDFFGVESLTSVRQLLEARVHLGHKTGMWDPRMKQYIFGTRAGIHIIDLDKTLVHLRRALNVAAHVAHRNGIILFVNERSQFERVVQQAARESNEYFVTGKWVGGTLTNSQMLLGTLRLPDLIIFLSVPPSKTAIKEAVMSNIPSIGVVDSDCNPNLITYPIPGNDDTPTAVKLYCSLFSSVILRAKAHREKPEREGQNIDREKPGREGESVHREKPRRKGESVGREASHELTNEQFIREKN